MKLGILIVLDANKRPGKVISEPAGYSETVVAYKSLVAGGVAPVAGFPILELWSSGGKSKSHKFREQIAAPSAAPTEDVAAEPDAEEAEETESEDTRPRGRGRR